MIEIKINSIDDLIEEIRKLKAIYGKQPIWFRGQEKSEWHLEPSIHRGKLLEKENYVTNDFYIYVNQIEDNAPLKEDYAAWMSLMQHYGLPTRILDWSSSPLVAINAYTVQQMLMPAFKDKVILEDQFVDKIIACHSVKKDLRMYSQQSSFTVHNSLRKLEDICDEETLFKFIIPQCCKESMYESLNILGISTRFIYPDMEHVSGDVIKKYSE